MEINELICTLLGDTDYPVFYILKPDNFDCDTYITFDTAIKNNWYSDNTYEAESLSVTINIVSKNQGEVPKLIRMIKDIIDSSDHCSNFNNRGNTYIKDTQEFFNASTFNYYVFK